MNKILLPSLALGAALAPHSAKAAKPEKTKPNIIFFIVDDLGWQDSSLPMWGDTTDINRMYHTPNLEKLASQGIKFTNAYASAVSSPTRVSLMTGVRPATHRVTNWTLHYDKSTDGANKTLNFPQWNVNGLQPEGADVPRSFEATVFPEILRDNGYFTIHVGKAHFGSVSTPGENPLNLGFDINIAGHAAGGPASFLGTKNFGNKVGATEQSPFAIPGLEEYWGQDIFATEALTLEAIKALDKAQKEDKPFYLYMSHYGVHVPFEADNRFYQKYRDMGHSHQWAQYASMVEGVDKSLGDLMQYLKDNDLEDNTIIFYISDNGGFAISARESHPTLGRRINYPLNSGKGSAYEGGIRVPLIVSLPNSAKANTTTGVSVDVTDLMPTILNLADVDKYKTVQKVEGRDITKLLTSPKHNTLSAKDMFWHFPNEWGATGPGIGTWSAIISGDMKLIYYYTTGETKLFNIAEDISEIVDLEGNTLYSKIQKDLAKRLTRYLKRTDAQLPTYKDGSYPSYPDGSPYKEKK